MMGKRYDQAKLRRELLLYAVTDERWLDGRTLAQCVEEALAAGVTMVQLREKDRSTEEIVALARELLPICHRYGAPLIIDDDIEAARLSGADGVHVGQHDEACETARRALGEEAIVGVSASTLEQAKAAETAGADYLGVGAMFGTPTKTDADSVTPEELRTICESVGIPVVAIGGLNEMTLSILENTGVAGAAVVSAIFAAPEISLATSTLLDMMGQIVGKE